MQFKTLAYRARIIHLFFLTVTSAVLLAALPVAAQENIVTLPDQARRLYLPSINNNSRSSGNGDSGNPTPVPVTSTPAPITPTPTPPPSGGDEEGFFPVRDHKTNFPMAATDSQGGMHLTYLSFDKNADGKNPAYYAYCAPGAACGNFANWRQVTLWDKVQSVQLKVTPAGQPRLLLATQPWAGEEYNTNRTVYRYAECNTGCFSAANWSLVTLGDVNLTFDTQSYDQFVRGFTLDADGFPAFFWGSQFPDLAHGFYARCTGDTGNCTDLSDWSIAQVVTGATFVNPVLKLTRNGSPRLLSLMTSGNGLGLTYWECDTACNDPDTAAQHWRNVGLAAGRLTADLELDGQDRPRIFLFGEAADGEPAAVYGWCNGGCLSMDAWFVFTTDEGANADADGLDLALDGQGRPRVAAGVRGVMSYMWCNSGCESDSAAWQVQAVDIGMDEDWEPAIPPTCLPGNSAWIAGKVTSLALDAQGNPRIAYTPLVPGQCWNGTDPATGEPIYQARVLYRSVRFFFMPQP